MPDDADKKPKPAPSPSREERLAQALRANLNRRKELARSKKTRLPREGDTPRDGE